METLILENMYCNIEANRLLDLLKKENKIKNFTVNEGIFRFPDKQKSFFKKENNFTKKVIENITFKVDVIAGCISFDSKVSFINCTFDNVAMFHGSVFEEEIIFESCTFQNISEFSSTYFLEKVTFNRCHFFKFLSLGLAQFKQKLIFTNNRLDEGSNMLGNKGKSYRVTFDEQPIIESNIGALDLNILP